VVVRSATLFNEASVMQMEGKRGRELVAVAPMSLIFRETDRTWSYRKFVSPHVAAAKAKLEPEGWVFVASYWPIHYFKREGVGDAA
jgi:hypothetical protein